MGYTKDLAGYLSKGKAETDPSSGMFHEHGDTIALGAAAVAGAGLIGGAALGGNKFLHEPEQVYDYEEPGMSTSKKVGLGVVGLVAVGAAAYKGYEYYQEHQNGKSSSKDSDSKPGKTGFFSSGPSKTNGKTGAKQSSSSMIWWIIGGIVALVVIGGLVYYFVFVGNDECEEGDLENQ